jgi:hypothetical protein
MQLEPNRPFVAPQPVLSVDAGLPPGRYRFRLEVVGTSGLRSAPAEVVVAVVPAGAGDEPRDTGTQEA